MNEEPVLFTREQGIATITMNRPQRLNAMNEGLMVGMREAVEVVKGDPDTRVLIITGAGRGFCSGMDINEFERSKDRGDAEAGKTAEAEDREEKEGVSGGRSIAWREVYSHKFCLSLMGLEKPVIAAVNGPAVGGGCDIALMCDIRVASDRAVFGEFYVRRGILPDEGGIYLLPRAVGMSWACELMFTGETIDAAQAERIGLVNRVVPHEQLLDAARGLAASIIKMPPLAVQMAKRALYWKERVGEFERSLHYAVSVSDALLKTEDHREGARAFIEKREPRYKGK